jgi:hypothetical protein
MESRCPRGSTRSEHGAWNREVGGAWAQVLRAVGLDAGATVVEVGPGFSDTIAHGLAALGFRGRILLVEPTRPARRWAATRYRSLLPAAETRLEPRALDQAGPAGEPVHALVSNHIFDDMLLRLAVPAPMSEALFARMRPAGGCAPTFTTAWRRLEARPATLDRLADAVAGELARYVALSRPRLVVLNQYVSWTQDRHGLSAIHEHGLRALRRLEEQLGRLGFVPADAAAPWLPVAASWLIMSSPDTRRDLGSLASAGARSVPAAGRGAPTSLR